MKKPLIAIPMGDPAGIGPEIVVMSMADEIADNTACLVIGSQRILRKAASSLNSPVEINVVSCPKEGDYRVNVLNILDIDNVDMAAFKAGEISGMCGKAAFDYIEKSIDLAVSKKVDAVATGPINKESLKAGGVNFIGHTEIFAELTKTHDPLTMFQVHNLRVFFLSRHVSLRKACDMVTKDRIIDYVIRCKKALEKLGVSGGTMAIAGLNPHSGEHGLFGDEEVNHVEPAVNELLNKGYDVAGPVPGDSVFHLALQGRFSSVLSLYHDQGHIATKTYDFERTISVTGGMPILRTSVDHGTALDIAWKGIASPVSMIEAIKVAGEYAPFFIND